MNRRSSQGKELSSSTSAGSVSCEASAIASATLTVRGHILRQGFAFVGLSHSWHELQLDRFMPVGGPPAASSLSKACLLRPAAAGASRSPRSAATVFDLSSSSGLSCASAERPRETVTKATATAATTAPIRIENTPRQCPVLMTPSLLSQDG